MKKILSIVLGPIILFIILSSFTLATGTDTSSIQELVALLREQIEKLKTQIEALQTQVELLKEAKTEVKETQEEIKQTLELTRQLWAGKRGEDVELLQEFLATDPEIYPEGLVTGYFGPLTRQAVKRFQKLAGIEQVGVVGPKTLAKINELLKEGAGDSGKVPPGLLIAPGIRKKLTGVVFEPLSGQELPPGIEKKLEHVTPPVDGLTPAVEGVVF